MPWTARQARYATASQHVQRESGRLTKHYVLTRHGAVARTFVPGGTFLVTVVLWRPSLRHPQLQGTVTMTWDGDQLVYQASDPDGRVVATTRTYLDAEAALLPRRTRTRSQGDYDWPAPILAGLTPTSRRPACDICGWAVRDGVCSRPDLHWTSESLAADQERRAVRRTASKGVTG